MSARIATPFDNHPLGRLPWVSEPDGPGLWLRFAWMSLPDDSDASAWPVHLADAEDVASHLRNTRMAYRASHGWQHMWLRLDTLAAPEAA